MVSLAISLQWYFDFEVKYETKCDAAVIKVVLDSGRSLELAQSLGCTTVDVIAQPLGYTALMSTLVGASAMIFGFYTNSGPSKRDP